MIRNINMNEFKKMAADNDVLILDARDTSEYKEKRIAKAVNIDLDNIESILKICPNKNQKILVYCTKGARSIVVAERLDKLGYKQIYNLHGGIQKILK